MQHVACENKLVKQSEGQNFKIDYAKLITDTQTFWLGSGGFWDTQTQTQTQIQNIILYILV